MNIVQSKEWGSFDFPSNAAGVARKSAAFFSDTICERMCVRIDKVTLVVWAGM